MVMRPIVVGVDGSEESMQAAEWAAMEARRHSSPLRIVSAPTVVPRIRAYNAAEETAAAALRGISARALKAAVARSEEVAPCLRVTTGLLSGPPAVAVAESGSDAAMLVVGARGTGGFAAMFLGSVSRYAATRALCPVVVVRRETMAVHREIAVGIRDPQDATEALAFAFEEAAARGADLVAVHAWFSLPSALWISAEVTRNLTATLDEWQDKYPKVRVRPDVIRGHPGRVLTSYSARADLVVLGRHGPARPASAGSAGPGIGSTLHAVLNHAHGPVAIVPARDRRPAADSDARKSPDAGQIGG